MLRLALSPAFSTVIPRAVRAVTAAKILSQPIAIPFRRSELQNVRTNIPNQTFRANFSSVSSLDAKENVDRKLRKALKREIKSFDPSNVEIPKPPSGFPFEIEDDPQETTVKLRREFDGEKLEVEVFDPVYPADCAADGEEIPAEICGGLPNIDRIQIVVNITKEDGEELEISFWRFVGRVGFHPTLFRINEISFSDEKVLSFDWEEIVRARGVDDSMVEFMIEYMNRREDRHHWITLKKFRDFLKE